MRILTLLFVLLPLINFAQVEVILSVDQPPEFGFSLSETDTTILTGSSLVLGSSLIVFGGSGEYQFHWSPGETLSDSTIMNPLASPSDTTVYLLTVTDEFGCSFSIDYTVNITETIVKNDLSAAQRNLEVFLFPNPNDGRFKVELKGTPSDKVELMIFDNNGKILKQLIIRNFSGQHTEIMQMELVSGVYTMKIDTGKKVLSRQFIVQ